MSAYVPRSYFFQAPQFKEETIALAKRNAKAEGKESGVLVICYEDGSVFTHPHTSVPKGEVAEYPYGEHYAALEQGAWA